MPELHGHSWLRGCRWHEAAVAGRATGIPAPPYQCPPPATLSAQGWCALIMIAFMVFFRLMALLALKRLNFQQR